MQDEMNVIRNSQGFIIQRSKNLAGIRRYVSKNIIKILAMDAISNYEGKLCILFTNGCSFETNFASYTVLKNFVRNWRNVYGSKLIINGSEFGIVEYKNPALKS